MQKRILFVLALTALLAACSTVPDSQSAPTQALTPTPALAPTPEAAEAPTPAFSSDPFNEGITARRNGNYPRAVAAFQATLNSNPLPDLMQEAQFRLGEAYWLNNDDTRAIGVLAAYLQASPNEAHAPEVHFFLADAYRAEKDYPNALAQLRLYREQSETLIGDTDAAIAGILVLAGESENAITQYDRALQDAALSNGTRLSILMRIADVHAGRGEPALAAARYDAAVALASDARTKADLLLRAGEAYAAAEKLDLAKTRWNDAINKYPDQPGAYTSLVDLLNRGGTVDNYQRGLVDYHAASYDAAIAAFERHLKSDSPRAGDARYFIASSYARKGKHSQAIAEYDKIIKSLPKDKRVPDAYFGKAAAYAALGKLDDAVAVYKKFVVAFPENERADDALWNAALVLDRAKRYGDAADLYEELRAKYPTRERAAEALFWAGMDHYRSKDFKTAGARWQTIAKEYSKSAFYTRALFWLGKAAQARGLTNDARNYWTQAASLNNGYYSWRAQDMLTPPKSNVSYDPARYVMGGDADRAEFEKWLADWGNGKASTSPRTPVVPTSDPTMRSDLHFRRGAELLRLDRTVEARREFMPLIESRKEDPRALYALALYFRDHNLFSLSLDCAEKLARLADAQGASPAPRFLWQLQYPTYYADLVLSESKANQIDPLLYFALIRQESRFNPWSTSSADARGLAQVVPSTAREIAQKLRVSNFSLDQLYLPYISVRFGVWYFARDLINWDEPIYALAAYNAGGSRVAKWQRPDLDHAVEEIDLNETATYVRVVYGNWKQYQTIYPGS